MDFFTVSYPRYLHVDFFNISPPNGFPTTDRDFRLKIPFEIPV
jgi:hypothetical protein